MKRKSLVFALLICAAVAILLCSCGKVSRPDYTSIEYCDDVGSLAEVFTFVQDAETVLWKTGAIGSRAPGPNSFEYKAFAVIPAELRPSFESRCDEEPCDVAFADGIDPADTGSSGFSWKKSASLTKELAALGYVGSVYYDIVNGVVHIDAATT